TRSSMILLGDIDSSDSPREITIRGEDSRQVAWSPDGRWIAVGGLTDQLRILDGANCGERAIIKARGGRVAALAFSPDGARRATGEGDGTVRLWDSAGGNWRKPIAEMKWHQRELLQLAFAPDGRRFYSGGRDNKVVEWSAGTASMLRAFDCRAH